MLSEFENQAGAISIAWLVDERDLLLDDAAKGIMGARPFRVGGGGSNGGGSGSEFAEKRVERCVGADSLSIKLRTLFEAGSSKESPALFLEPIGELRFIVIEGDRLVWLYVDMAWVVVDRSSEAGGDTGREGGSEMGGEGGGDTGHEGGSEPGREGGTSSISTSGP